MNIAEILKHKPEGTKLYDYLYDKVVEFDGITTEGGTVIWCKRIRDYNVTVHHSYSKVGTMRDCEEGLQILLPSKEMRDWSKFAWERGDILKSDGNMFCFFDKFSDDSYTCFEAKYMRYNRADGVFIAPEVTKESVEDWYEKASPEEAREYIKEVEKTFNGKFNMETLEVVPNKPTEPTEPTKPTEPKFKPFDKVVVRIGSIWYADIFSHKCGDESYQCVGGCYDKVLPYNEETAKLIGTREDHKNV